MINACFSIIEEARAAQVYAYAYNTTRLTDNIFAIAINITVASYAINNNIHNYIERTVTIPLLLVYP